MGQEARRDRHRFHRLASGDATALAEIYDAHAGRLYRLALWITRSKMDAEDVVQDVMVKVASMGPELYGIRAPAPYLLQMARSRSLDCLARGQRQEPLEEAPEPEAPVAAPGDAAVVRALEMIAPDQREAVYLHVREGLTFREIGKTTGVSTFTAASRYRLGIQKLRQRIGEEERS